jgi:hypothetical protein
MGGAEGAPEESECPKLSRKTEEGQKEEEVRKQKTEPIDADAIPGSESRSPQSQYWGLGTGGGWCAGIPPATLKDPGRRCGGGGCPAPSRQGWCEGWSASDEGTATRQGGRANRHNPSNLGGERAMKGKPPGSRALPPAGGLGSRGPERIPRQGGQRFSGHSTTTRCLLDNSWCAPLPHQIPGQGRPPGPIGGWAYPGAWRGVQGSPGGEGAERYNLDAPSHRIPRVLSGWKDDFR